MQKTRNIAWIIFIGGLFIPACGGELLPLADIEVPSVLIEGERVTYLTAVAETTILASGLELERDAEVRLENLIDRGEAKLVLAPSRRAEATANLARLLATIIEITEARGDSSITVLSVELALGICPVWPIC